MGEDPEKPLSATDTTSRSSALEDLCPGNTVDTAAERKLLWKCDVHVVPVVSLLYMLAFIDRINIGNARIQGLEDDLRMSGNDFDIALFIFFIPYILFEVPSNIIIRKLSPSTWLSFIMVCWGITTVCQGVTRSYAGLLICRFFLGLFEAGFFPGCAYLISMYYKPHELQWRFNLFFCMSILAGSFSGLLAYALANMNGIGGYSGWRWIFILEGLATVVFSAISKFFIVDWPETASFLTSAERQLLLRRLSLDAPEARMDRFDETARRRVFLDWKIYVGTIAYLGIVNNGYATSFFTPTILKQFHWTSVHAQVMSIPIYVVACVLALLVAYLTDRYRHRYGFAMLGLAVATIGYVLLLCQDNISVSVRYLAIYLITAGGYITQPIVLVWLMNNLGGHYKRSIGAAVQIGFGNCGGIVASNIYLTKEAPTYPVGFGVSLALLWLCGLACTIFYLGLRMENRKREKGGRDYRLSLPHEELENLGDDHPAFRFIH